MTTNVAKTPTASRPSVLYLKFKEKKALYAAYMPLVKRGGLFIPTNRSYRLGDEVYLLLSLLDEEFKLPIAGRVVWVTPPNAQGGKAQGMAVQFSDDESGLAAKRKIEVVLAGHLESSKPTHTI